MTLQLFLPCAAGVETMLADEVLRIARANSSGMQVKEARGGVYARGDWADVLALNLHSRLCQRVLVEVMHAEYRSEDDIYQAACDTLWEDWFEPRQTFKIDATASRSPLQSLNFAALRVKDGLCDRFRHYTGSRPSVDTERPDVRVFAHFNETHVTLSVDTSGEPLFKRGWRFDKGDAPLKETLAAAMLEASGWAELARTQGLNAPPLVDPCCGSGTIPIEAAQILAGIAPGLKRRFGFERLLPHKPAAWTELKNIAMNAMNTATGELKAVKNDFAGLVFGSDLSFRMVDFATTNAERAGVANWLNLRGGDALQRAAPVAGPGVLLMNPPYGERIEAGGVAGVHALGVAQDRRQPQHEADPSQREAASDFFVQLAAHWKRNYAGWNAWVLSPDMKFPGSMRLKEMRRVPMWNGPIECRLFKFELLSGSPREIHGSPRGLPSEG